MNNLSLVYVNPIGKDSNDIYEYEFFFSETPEIVWGEDWHIPCPSACGVMKPEESTYSVIKHLKTEIKLFCAQENSCFSMQDCIDQCIALCFQDINNLEEYPEHRFVVHFGEKYEKVVDQLHILDLDFEENDYVSLKDDLNEFNENREDDNDDTNDEIDDSDGGIWNDDRYPLDLQF